MHLPLTTMTNSDKTLSSSFFSFFFYHHLRWLAEVTVTVLVYQTWQNPTVITELIIRERFLQRWSGNQRISAGHVLFLHVHTPNCVILHRCTLKTKIKKIFKLKCNWYSTPVQLRCLINVYGLYARSRARTSHTARHTRTGFDSRQVEIGAAVHALDWRQDETWRLLVKGTGECESLTSRLGLNSRNNIDLRHYVMNICISIGY